MGRKALFRPWISFFRSVWVPARTTASTLGSTRDSIQLLRRISFSDGDGLEAGLMLPEAGRRFNLYNLNEPILQGLRPWHPPSASRDSLRKTSCRSRSTTGPVGAKRSSAVSTPSSAPSATTSSPISGGGGADAGELVRSGEDFRAGGVRRGSGDTRVRGDRGGDPARPLPDLPAARGPLRGRLVDRFLSFLGVGLLEIVAHELLEGGQRLLHLGAELLDEAALLGEREGAEPLVAGTSLGQELDPLGEHVEELDDLFPAHLALDHALLHHRHHLEEGLVELFQPVVHAVLLFRGEQGLEVLFQLLGRKCSHIAPVDPAFLVQDVGRRESHDGPESLLRVLA